MPRMPKLSLSTVEILVMPPALAAATDDASPRPTTPRIDMAPVTGFDIDMAQPVDRVARAARAMSLRIIWCSLLELCSRDARKMGPAYRPVLFSGSSLEERPKRIEIPTVL